MMKINSARFVKGIRGTDEITDDIIPQIAFVGRSNVGKSSVIESLIGSQVVVKTGKKPGKTREINFFNINNNKCYFVDLPGYGYAKIKPAERDQIRKMIIWYLTNSRPQLVVLVIDSKIGLTDFDLDMIDILTGEKHPFLIIANKIDKLNQKEWSEKSAELSQQTTAEIFPYSAKEKKRAPLLADRLLNF